MRQRQPGREVARQAVLFADQDELGEVKLPGATRDWQVRCVCGGSDRSCNNGWMREIENRAKPILVPLIKGESAIISPNHQNTIASWAILKSMVSEVAFGRSPITSLLQRQQFRRQKLPPRKGWAVWIGHFNRERVKTEWYDCRFSISLGATGRASPDHSPFYNGNVTNQVIGKFFVQVIHSPEKTLIENWRSTLRDGGTLFRIWPATPYRIAWPGQYMTDGDACDAINGLPRFFKKVSAAMRVSQFVR